MNLTEKQLAVLHRRFPSRRAAITGAASGVGRALALALSQHDWKLWLNDWDAEALETLVKELKVDAQYQTHVFDVADKVQFDTAIAAFHDEYGSVDLLFNAAGIGVGGTFSEVSIKHWREVIDINVLGTVHGCMAVLPGMVKAGRGHLVNIASAAAFHAMPHLSAYSASKAAVVALSETLKSELKGTGVDISVKMTTFYRSNVGKHTRGSATERAKSQVLVTMASLTSEQVANDLLLAIQAKKFYILAPRLAGFLWRFKRFLPGIYLAILPRLFAKLDAKLAAQVAKNRE